MTTRLKPPMRAFEAARLKAAAYLHENRIRKGGSKRGWGWAKKLLLLLLLFVVVDSGSGGSGGGVLLFHLRQSYSDPHQHLHL